MELLHEQIKGELKKLCNDDDAFGWLISPQERLDWRIPARMMATGDGAAVLHALQNAVAEGRLGPWNAALGGGHERQTQSFGRMGAAE